jgi:hypothetical protein
MKILRYTKPIYSNFLFLLCWLLLAAPVYGAQFEEEVSSQEYLFVKGIIHSVSIEDQTLTIKPHKSPTISVSIDKDTVFEGFYKLTELKVRENIKVWYQPKEQENKALKILKPLKLGC